MTTRATRVVSALLSTLLLGVLAGCGGNDTPKDARASAAPSEPAKVLTSGTCWDDTKLADALGPGAFATWVQKYAAGNEKLGESMRDDAAFNKQVDCSKAHSLELYNVVELAPALSARVQEYADLLDQKSRLYRKVRDQVNDRCLAPSPYGLAQRRAGDLPVQLGPSLNPKGGLHVAWDPFPADLWAKGQQKFVCTFEQDKPGTLRFADITTSKLPLSARVCLNTPSTFVPCRGRHQAEDIGEMILNTAVERGRITGRRAVRKGTGRGYVSLPDAEYAKLDRVCQTLFRRVSKTGGGVAARAYPGSVAQWPTRTGDYVARCFALKPYDPPPPIKGTVFDRVGRP